MPPPDRALSYIDLLTVFNNASTQEKANLRAALGAAGVGGTGISPAAFLAQLKEVTDYVSGEAIIGFDASGAGTSFAPAVVSMATTFHLLTGATGLIEYGQALHRWLHKFEALGVTSGVATFLWPKDADGERDRTSCRRITTGANVSLAIEALSTTSNPQIHAQDLRTRLTFDVVNSGQASITVQIAAAAAGRMPADWGDEGGTLSIPVGGSARITANIARNVATLVREQGAATIVPVSWVETAAQTSISNSFTLQAPLMTVGDFLVMLVSNSTASAIPGLIDGWAEREGFVAPGGNGSARIYTRRTTVSHTATVTLPTNFAKAAVAAYRNMDVAEPVIRPVLWDGSGGALNVPLVGVPVGSGAFVVGGYWHATDQAMPVHSLITQRAIRSSGLNRYYLGDTGGVVTSFDAETATLPLNSDNMSSFAMALRAAEVST